MGKGKVKKKTGKRSKAKNPGLKKQYFSKIKQEFHDIDYADKLSDEHKEWLNNFMEEDLGARFNHEGERIYKNKEDELESYRRNNKRNVDLYSTTKASGELISYELILESDEYNNENNAERNNLGINLKHEDTIIDLIDFAYKLDDEIDDPDSF